MADGIIRFPGNQTNLATLRPSESESLRFLHLAIESCDTFAASAKANLLAGDQAAAQATFRYAEEAFEEAQQYLAKVDRLKWRDALEPVVDSLAVQLDRLWVGLISAGGKEGAVAEDSANRTHQRLEEPPNGFEDRPGHQPRLSSVI